MASPMTDIHSDLAIPPGEFLAEEIEARGMTQGQLAEKMGRPRQVINGITRGHRAITAETALQLEDVLGLSAQLWMNLESEYRLVLARNAAVAKSA